MPMSPRLLRPIASSLDPDAAVYLNAVAAADGAQLEPAVKKAINDFVRGCKSDGIWSAIKASCILMGARTLAGALTPLVGTAPSNNGPFVAGDYNRKTGLVGDGTTKYLNSNRNSNADPQDSFHYAVWCSALHSGASAGAYIGAGSTGSGASALFRAASSGSHTTRNRTSISSAVAAASVGFFGSSRSASSAYVARTGSADYSVSQASETPVSVSTFVFARNDAGAASLPANGRIAFYTTGESLNLALLDTRVSALIAAIGAAIP